MRGGVTTHQNTAAPATATPAATAASRLNLGLRRIELSSFIERPPV
jgi:hypothetical protein